MRTALFTLLSLCLTLGLFAQAKADCNTHPVFNLMPNHSVRNCEEKEFAEIEIYVNDPKLGRTTEKKSGHYHFAQVKFDGEMNKAPSAVQIAENYANAIKNAGGIITYKSSSSVYGKVKKGGNVYWVSVSTDGSGDYWMYTVQEEAMKQDVVVTAEVIKSSIKDEGKVAFYGIYFDTDKSVVKPESDLTLAEIAKYLKADPGVNVYIVGHTDNTGDLNHNLILSKERAEAVVAKLVGGYGINKSQVMAQGVASLSPVAGNDTNEGKAKNRRVEIVKR